MYNITVQNLNTIIRHIEIGAAEEADDTSVEIITDATVCSPRFHRGNKRAQLGGEHGLYPAAAPPCTR